tara:strand:+ start:7563 stop:8483 length:921 start_codon:yes stop_codon:yes gene_type:complete
MTVKKQTYLLFLLLHSLCYAQTNIQIYADTNCAFIGDVIQIQLDVITNQNIQWPDIEMDISPIEIQKTGRIDTINEEQFIRYSQKLTIQQFDSGRFVIPSLKFIQANEDTFYSDSLSFQFLNIELDTNNRIFDIKGPKEVPFHLSEAKPYIISLMLFVLVLLLVIFIFRKFSLKKSPQMKFIPVVPCEEEAINALKALEKEKLYEKGEAKEHYVKLTAILKHYFDRQYAIESMESTSAETLELLNDIDLDSSIRNDISKLLIDSDMIKFAKVIPELNEHKVMISKSYDIVNKCYEQMLEKEEKVNV